jgi:drug/metabolite transporter (DMT)-like permease
MLIGILSGLATGALWGLTFVGPRAVAPFTVLDLAITRYLLFGVTSALLMLHPRFRPAGLGTRAVVVALLLGTAGYVGYFIAVAFAVGYAGTTLPPLVIGLLPVALALIGNRDGGVPWGRLALPLGLIGAGVLTINLWSFTVADTGHGRAEILAGLVCALVALAIWIGYGVVNAGRMRAADAPGTLPWTGLQGLGAALGVVPLMVIARVTGDSGFGTVALSGPAGLRFLVWSALLGLGGSWLATWWWSIASRRLPLALSAQLIVTETMFGLIFGFVFEGRWPMPAEWIGSGLQLSGVMVAVAVFTSAPARRVVPAQA